ncbi:Sensor protein yycG [Candidatus Methylomirabilis lanthanidiphila]|uniref:histidine kinase n=1 Tax=Candidatus Methylomirabilis lanthanidiphila TaxID=2211376 RepID=A0A564ZM94_9BACT|nr:cell wall metabolism sensor histidine kinase WalK [Candidatus Methylomirabilis lanthanidiphila]VUZ86449.1 Sensor protein yycG [Candidatus Methylomirabilis lanthanidiphila]
MSWIEGGFQRKLIATYLLIVLAIVAVAGIYLFSSLERASIDRLKVSLHAQAQLMSNEVTPAFVPQDTGRLHKTVQHLAQQVGTRVTVIRMDGTVLADSERTPDQIGRMDNHLHRPEVQTAIGGGVGSVLRRSDTLGVKMLYLAIPLLQDGAIIGVLRVAMPLSDLNRELSLIRQPLIIGGLLAMAAAVALGFVFARQVTRPILEMTTVADRIAKGDFSRKMPAPSSDEIGQLGRALNLMAGRLEDRLAELEGERAKGAAILDSMVEGVVAVDGAIRILLINASACRLLSTSSDASVGRPFLEVIRNKELLDLLNRTLNEGTFAQQELQIFTLVQRVLQVHASPLKGRAQTVGAMLVLHDVTELRRLEAVRTEFVANVSHELRTPLTSIRGYLETLLEGGLEDREHARPFLEVIHRHTERLGRLLDDLRDLSNIEFGKVPFHRQPTVLAEVVQHAMAIYEPQAARQDVALQVDLPHDLPHVLADRDRLTQILINLLDNGLKFTPKGGRVTVTAKTVQGSRFKVQGSEPDTQNSKPETQSLSEVIEIAVQDTGAGIPSQDLPRITERFYRVDRARSRELGGTGLGLAIVKHLVKAHGGELIIDSVLNRGTTVRFTLPIAPPDSETA